MSRFIVTAVVVCAGTLIAQNQPGIRRTTIEPTSASSGEEMYTTYCAVCHGKDGKGGGPAARALTKQPPDLTQLAKSNGGKYPTTRIYASISGEFDTPAHGSRDMPIWGAIFRASGSNKDAVAKLRVTNLTKHIEKLQEK